MTITQIRAFYLAATLGSFTAAAEYMGLTQPTISELVRKVEDQYGMALFVRRGRRLVLTTAGQALMPWAKRLLDAELGADSALTALGTGEGGTVSFGILKNANYYHLSELAAVFREAHPMCAFDCWGRTPSRWRTPCAMARWKPACCACRCRRKGCTSSR